MESFSLIPLSLATIFASFYSTDVDEPVITTHNNPEIVGLWEIDFDATPNFDLMDEFGNEFNNSENNIDNQSNPNDISLANVASIENDANFQGKIDGNNNYRELVLAIQESKTQNNELIKIVTEDSISTESINQSNTELDNDALIEIESTTITSTYPRQEVSAELNQESNLELSQNSNIEDAQVYSDLSHHSVNNINAENQTYDSATELDYIVECKERYNFQSDNLLITSSGKEWTYGQYLYEHQAEGLPVIAMTTTYDNNEVDCSGNQIDQKGESIFAYVDYQPDENVMRWCIDNQGDKCFLTLRKLLP